MPKYNIYASKVNQYTNSGSNWGSVYSGSSNVVVVTGSSGNWNNESKFTYVSLTGLDQFNLPIFLGYQLSRTYLEFNLSTITGTINFTNLHYIGRNAEFEIAYSGTSSLLNTNNEYRRYLLFTSSLGTGPPAGGFETSASISLKNVVTRPYDLIVIGAIEPTYDWPNLSPGETGLNYGGYLSVGTGEGQLVPFLEITALPSKIAAAEIENIQTVCGVPIADIRNIMGS